MTRWVGVLFAVALGVGGRAAQAQTTMGLIISGDCRDPDLAQNARQLARVLKGTLGDRLLTDDGVRSRLSPQPAVTAEDLARQLEAAETLFYNGEYAKAETAILHALEEIRRFPPGQERWKLDARAELLESQVIRRLGRATEADELFRHVLRLQPSFQLDPDYFMPSIRQKFDRFRKELQATRRVRVEVKSLPPGAEIYLDGVKQSAVTPAALEVWPGDYELIVAREGQRSLPHQLAAYRENSILVDLQFEGAIQLDRDPCFATRAGDERTRLAGALKVATLLGVDTMVVLNLDRAKTGPSALGATVLDTRSAATVRWGKIKLPVGAQDAPSAIGELAKFVMTGESGKQLVAADGVKSPAPAVPAPAPASARQAPSAPPKTVPLAMAANPGSLVPVRTPAATTAAPAAGDAPGWLPRGWRGEAVLGLGASGAGVAVVGGVLLGLGNRTMYEANNYFAYGPPNSGQVQEIAQMRDTARIEQGVGVAGLIAGAVGLVSAATLWQTDAFASPPGKSASLSVGVTRGGAAVQVGGSF